MKSPKIVLGFALAAVAATSACGQGVLGDKSESDDKGPIVLGMNVPMSGSSAEIGPRR